MRAEPAAEQTMGPWMATALVMGVMIGSGVFLLPAQLAPYGWNGVVAWIISIAGALALAYVIARLTQVFPGEAGPTAFVARAFGRVAGFSIGWSYWVSVWVTVVTLAVAAVSNMSVFLPVIGTTPLLPSILAVIIVWIVTAINVRGVRAAGAFQIVTMAIKLIPLLLVVVILGVVLGGKGSAVIAPFPSQGLDFTAISAAASLTLFALTGLESASITAARVTDPDVNIPRATLYGTGITGLLYLIVCSGIALTLPLALAQGASSPFAVFVEHFWARGPALAIAVFVAVSAIGAMNGNILMQGELPLTMARQASLPRWIGVTSASDVPVRALIVSSAIASVFLLMNASRSMSNLFGYLAQLSASATLWLYLGCALAALRLRVAVPIALFGTLYSLWALWGAGIAVSGLSFALMAMGLPLYAWARVEARRDTALTV